MLSQSDEYSAAVGQKRQCILTLQQMGFSLFHKTVEIIAMDCEKNSPYFCVTI